MQGLGIRLCSAQARRPCEVTRNASNYGAGTRGEKAGSAIVRCHTHG